MEEEEYKKSVKFIKNLLDQISDVIIKDKMANKIKMCPECGGRMLVNGYNIAPNKDNWECYDCGYEDSYYILKEETKDETIKNLEELLRQKSDLVESMEIKIKYLEHQIKRYVMPELYR